MRKLVISLAKGGIGKSVTAVHLGHALALEGRRVLLVDCDTQGHCADFLGVKPKAGLAEVILDGAPAKEAMVEAREGLWILDGGERLTGVRRQLARMDEGAEEALKNALGGLRGFDYVILDTGPGWDEITLASLFYAEDILAPVSLEVATIYGLMEFQKRLKRVQPHHKKLRLRYVLPTFYDRRVRKSDEILSQLKGHFPEELCQPIRYSVRLSECLGFGQTVFEYAKRSSGVEDYQALARRVADDG